MRLHVRQCPPPSIRLVSPAFWLTVAVLTFSTRGLTADEKPSVPSGSSGKVAEDEGELILKKKPRPLPAGEKPAASQPPETVPATKPLKPESKKPANLDDELLKKLDPPEGEDEAGEIDRLERAIRHMRQAQQRIQAQDAGTQTLEAQQLVIRDLEALIKAVRDQAQNPSSQNSSSSQKQSLSGKQRKIRVDQQLDPQNSSATRPDQKPQPGSGQRRSEEPSSESSNRSEKGKPTAAELARQRDVIKDAWGHLPPALRDKLLNVYSEKYLPQYEDLVRRYYESLAEKNRPAPSTGAPPGRK